MNFNFLIITLADGSVVRSNTLTNEQLADSADGLLVIIDATVQQKHVGGDTWEEIPALGTRAGE